MTAPSSGSFTDLAVAEGSRITGSRLIVPPSGSLATVVLTHLLSHIARYNLTAELEVSTGSAVKSIHFENGVVVFAKSNVTTDRLGHCLLQTGKISADQFNAIDQRIQRDGIRFGEALVAQGWMTPREVVRHVGSHLGRIVLSLFPLQEGEYSFEERSPRVPSELKVKLFTGQLLLYGIRRMPARAILRSPLPGKQTPLECVDPAPGFLEVTRLQPLERAIIDAVRKGATLGSLEELLGEALDDIRRSTYGLLASGILTACEEGSYVSSGGGTADPPRGLYPRTEAWNEDGSSSLGAAGDPVVAEQTTPPERGAATDEDASSSSASGPQPSSERNDETTGKERQLLETVELHIAVGDWRQSIPLLTELLEIAPQNARYNVLLACALGKCKGLEKHAERQFQRALRYAPQSADLYCEFGHFYVAMGRAGRATQQFQEALRLDPNHKKAQQAMQQRRKDQGSLGSLFKKILR